MKLLSVVLCLALFSAAVADANIDQAMDEMGWGSDEPKDGPRKPSRTLSDDEVEAIQQHVADLKAGVPSGEAVAAKAFNKLKESPRDTVQRNMQEAKNRFASHGNTCTALTNEADLASDPHFTVDLNGKQCFGLTSVPADSALECRNACCASKFCNIWQYCSGSECSPQDSCWIVTGFMDIKRSCSGSQEGWISRARQPSTPLEKVQTRLMTRDFMRDFDSVTEELKALSPEDKREMMMHEDLKRALQEMATEFGKRKDGTRPPPPQQQQQQQAPKKRTAPPLVEPEDSKVLVLDHTNFTEVLSQQPLALVEFYAPWCGHCKRLFPEYTAASKLLDGKVTLAKIDANEDENRGVSRQYGVRGFPTLKVFVNGEVKEAYQGGRSADAIYETMIGYLNENPEDGAPKDEL